MHLGHQIEVESRDRTHRAGASEPSAKSLPSAGARLVGKMPAHTNDHNREEITMQKSIIMPAAAIALAVAAWTLLPIPDHQAAAQSGPYLVNAVNLDIVPEQFDKFMEVANENGAASVKDPGCREFDIVVAQNDPHHVMFFEVYDNAAALDAHRATDHFKKYQATTKDMVAKRDVRQFSSVAMNIKGM
jgi:(4S)-4-hydroxy-5-phosphonooxypentane-2,3-dione isomerase